MTIRITWVLLEPVNRKEITKIVSANVRRAVDLAGTQAILASRAGVTQGAISKFCRAEALPTGMTANKLSNAVGGKLKPCDFAPHIFNPPH